MKKVRKRDITFTSKTKTRIWREIPADENPYLAKKCLCHGYDLMDLARKRDFGEVLFLLLVGELPTPEQRHLLNGLMVSLVNPGPRHPAGRAAMLAGVGKSDPAHILPIGLSVLGGAHGGGNEVSAAMEFFRKQTAKEPGQVFAELSSEMKDAPGDKRFAPGFGTLFGSIDPMAGQIANLLADLPPCGKALPWAMEFADLLAPLGMGLLSSGVAAAVFCDLGFPYRAGAGLFQLIAAPGLLAHGLELANKPLTAMPFPDEEHFVISDEAKKRTT
ncbi:citrate synthase [Thermodesulfobacteriota bacterium]